MIDFQNVAKSFQKTNRIEALTFSVQPGECLALCGGNGAGKSTIIKMMTGIYTPSSGSISLNGFNVSKKENQYKKQFAYMPDNIYFPPSLSGEEVLQYFADLQGANRSEVDDLLRLVGLYEERKKKVKVYSKGMQQRIAFAQSLLSDSPIWILDEPTNGLDPYWVHRLKEIVLAKKAEGKTIVFSTHILSVVEDIADTLLFIQDGKMFIHESVPCLLEKGNNLEEALFQQYQ
ncbi:ABC-2 type transport system ATP-binding protein [Oikeobacillus pervagus]|uniref:ABC-2 type transport system ATP-binding protein n=1 Tax=Oikeobacillus pervagus TaxID=1325931 RepID=A0AAJ1WJJ2_9BACI|nr:ABC transporter ATP-binding protein [Oikeobacillus pervagus]MDQ0215523.1 ABC-2 type transport system ATP-binding protein [Oikeobacillus pervagus]